MNKTAAAALSFRQRREAASTPPQIKTVNKELSKPAVAACRRIRQRTPHRSDTQKDAAHHNNMAAPTGSSADSAEKLRTYGEQLAQVEQLLAQDPNNEQFKKLRQDLLEVTKLTEDLLEIRPRKKSKSSRTRRKGMKRHRHRPVPSRCDAGHEGKFNDGWYPAVITAVAGGAYTVVYIDSVTRKSWTRTA